MAYAGIPATPERSLPGPYNRPGPAPMAAAQQGHVAVTVNLANAPPGTTISATGSGIAQAPKTNVGYGYHQGH